MRLKFISILASLAAWHSAEAQVSPIFTNTHPQPASVFVQLQGTYFNDTTLTTPVFTRNDSTINFNWGLASPDPRINADNFSVRWSGFIVPPYSGTYTFYATADDGIRLWVNDQLLIDAWVDQAATEYSQIINLTADTLYDFTVEYYEHAGDAVASVSWSGPNISKEIIGSSFYPSGAGDAFGSTLASFDGGQYAVGVPLLDSISRGFYYTDFGRLWYGDSTGGLLLSPSSPYPPFLSTGPVSRYFAEALSGMPDGRLITGRPGYSFGTFRGGNHYNIGGVNLTASPGTNENTLFVGNPGGAIDNTYFGFAVGGLAGSSFAASSTDAHGTVFLFDASQPSPVVTGVITNPNPVLPLAYKAPYPWSWIFGSALAGLGTNRVLIGAPFDSTAGDFAGSVYIYDFSGALVRPPIHNPTQKGDFFGNTVVAVDDHRFLVGAPSAILTYNNGLGTNLTAGAVYLYDDTGTRLLTFTAPDISVSGNFGTAIALLGSDRVLIGSPNEKVGNVQTAGRVHLFTLAGVHLETIDKTTAHLFPGSGDRFGAAIAALDERRFVVGAPGDDWLQTDAGSVYGFDAPSATVELGAEIPKPNGVNGADPIFQTQGPTVTPAGGTFWHAPSQKLFAVKTGNIMVSWPLVNSQVYNWQATVGWPTNNARYQIHVGGQTPVDLSAGGAYSNVVLEATTTDADPAVVNSSHRFSALNPGLSLMMLSAGDPASNAIRFQLVRTIAWNDPTYLFDNAPATVGQPITDPGGFHDAAAGSPQVVLAGGVYCPAPVFDPVSRTGSIIPVNKDNPANPADDLVVAFYQRGTLLYDPATGLAVSNNIYWPYKPVRYQPQWPTNAPTIVIASLQGTGVIDPAQYVNWQLYYQNDPAQSGFNPNDEHALRLPYSGGEAVFALRDDLGTAQTSQPFVLIRYQDPNSAGQWRMKVWQVVAEQAPWFFRYAAQAGVLLQAPFPISLLAPAPQTVGVSGPYWRDRKLSFWARAAGNDGGNADIVMHYFYPMQDSFFYPGNNPPPTGSNVPLLDLQAGTPGTPIDVHFDTSWPSNVPVLRVGETLVKPKFGLPDISSQTSAEIVYDQSIALDKGTIVQLIDPTREYHVDLALLPSDLQTTSENGVKHFPALPPQLHDRFFYDPTGHTLRFRGQFIAPPAGEYYLLLNVLTAREIATLLSLSTDPAFQNAVNALGVLAANVTGVPSNATGFDSLALTAGLAQGQGYITLAFGNNTNLSPLAEPVSLAVIKVSCPTYQGEIKVIESDNPFDEKLTLRHSGDFAGKADSYVFEWRTLPPGNDGLPSTAPRDQWTLFSPTPATGLGAVDITISGPGLFTLSDNYFVCRYRPASSPLCNSPTNTLGWSDWTAPMLAEGWIKRVLTGINPFEQRIKSYGSTAVNTVVSMISQAGPPYQGPVALNQQNANQFGLIETYETVLRRGESLSINGAPAVNYGPANDALLLAAGRLADLYMLLGNEAFADAADPTIAFGTDDKVYGAEATSIHCFMNQTASLMEEELDLLRGRDNSLLPGVTTPPVYNRLFWNFTSGIDGGEVAYALNYNIHAANGSVSGTISAADAQALYPQGHGDAWGHYLSAIKNYYRLLRNPNFTWVPRIEAVNVGGTTISVDYYDERKFAAAAAARAQAGAEIVNLTYRSAYVEDPTGQWQGYQDANTNRAWGLAEWGSRAGQGAFFDWVAGNALLPDKDPDPTHTDIRKIDRTTVTGLRDIGSALNDIQTKVDQADSGLNPLGLAKNVVPFDIDPTQIAAGKTHFEQIYDRAVVAINNAVTVFNHANNSTQLLRQQADDVAKFQQTVTDKETDFNSRLIEVFGYPYGDDIGPTGAYPTGYNGPDIYHYDYVDSSVLQGQTPPPTQTFTATLTDFGIVGSDGSVIPNPVDVQFTVSSEDLGLVKPASWTMPRRAPGQIQMARSDLLQGYTRFRKALDDYKSLIAQIEDTATLLQIQYDTSSDEIKILNENLKTQIGLNDQINTANFAANVFDTVSKNILNVASATAETLPKVVGLATDVTAPARGSINLVAAIASKAFSTFANVARDAVTQDQQAKEITSLRTQIAVTSIKDDQAFRTLETQLEVLIRQEASARLELLNQQEALQQLVGRYSSALAAGERLLEDRLRFRQDTAAQIQTYRYKDMAFRIFRNDTLQKYRAQFDLAAMYVYLAARAYDYETNLKKGDPRGPGSDFMTGIIRSRSLGLIENGLPQTGAATGDPGLADPMARMNLDWTLVLKGQLGFNNPQTETGRFSLRSELFRIQPNSAGSKVWRDTLTRNVVANIQDLPEFKRFCIPFQPALPVEPAIVIPFSTSINFGQNFFGWPAGGSDNDYDSTHFVTKIRSVGVWFANFNNLNMINTPRVYLIPVGEDVLRSPSSDIGDIRQWRILDQKLPIPFPLSAADLAAPTWIPINDTLSDQIADIRQYAEFRAYHDAGNFDPSQTISDTRLIGRSVWNTRWLLIIPAGNLLSDRNEGIQRFINGSLLPNGQRDGNGVTDIKIFFQTYAFSGN